MKRKIVEIDESKCTGCGLCVKGCHEGAIALVNGKAKLVKDDYCDGLGDCLPHCPSDAIRITTREASSYDEVAVEKRQEELGDAIGHMEHNPSVLKNWPIQIRLAPIKSKAFENAHLLIACDCVAYSYASFHHDFMNKRVTLIGCPKLDRTDYSEKLQDIIENNNIKSITLVRMEVPCCSHMDEYLIEAIKRSGKDIHYSIRVISIEGDILECY